MKRNASLSFAVVIMLVSGAGRVAHSQNPDEDDAKFLQQSQDCDASAKRGTYCLPRHDQGKAEAPTVSPALQNDRPETMTFYPGCSCEHWDTVSGKFVCFEWRQSGDRNCQTGELDRSREVQERYREMRQEILKKSDEDPVRRHCADLERTNQPIPAYCHPPPPARTDGNRD